MRTSRRGTRPAAAALLVAGLLAGCGGNGPGEAAGPADPGDPGWWRPAPGEIAGWDWQISEPYDLSAPHAMYDLDLFDLAPEGSELRYPDGEVIEVPAGPLAGAVAELHARDPAPVVICYLDTGAWESYRPDAGRFPSAVLGRDTGWEEERWLDIREESRDAFAATVWARLDLAARMGCDGVEPDQNNPVGNDPGFPITPADQISWYREVARQAHARGLSVGMKNGHDLPGAAEELAGHFDWALPEECAQFGECGALRAFTERGLAVFAVDYAGDVDPEAACALYREYGFDGLIKDEPPTGAHRTACPPDPASP